MNEKPFAVLHVPHSSREIPSDVRRSFVLSDRELEAELIRLTDSYTGYHETAASKRPLV